MSWSVGFTDTSGENEVFADDLTFRQSMILLRVFAGREMRKADELEMSEWNETISNINDICSDTGIMDDPDQWEDMEFNTPIGEYWIVQN
jgi:hypothetical protein